MNNNYQIRKAEKLVKEYASFYKVIAVLGARQVGKSSMLANMYPDYKYFTFDPVQDLYGARSDPDLFLKNFPPPLILDEIQYVPELIPAIKRFADKLDNKGQYFITGSQNLPVLKNISESLAGRVGIIRLHPMTGDELNNIQSDKSWLSELLNNGKIPGSINRFSKTDTLSSFLWRGTMPGLIDAPDSLVSSYFDSYVQTYIERDIRIIEDVKNLSDFGRFIRLCSSLTAQEINSSQIGREIGVTPQTARRWLDLLIHSFQWIELDPYSGSTIKRISGKKKGYLSDTGLAAYLQRISSPDALMGTRLFGALFETYVVTSIIKNASLMSTKPGMYHWRTSAGAEADVVLEYNGKLFPIEIKAKTNLNKHDASGITAFFETYPSNTEIGIIIYAGSELYRIKENIWAMPWDAV